MGKYNSLHLTPQPALTASNCPVGTLYANSSDLSQPYYCAPTLPLTTYLPLPGVWNLNGNYLTLTDTSTPENKKVGIGTATPIFKLTLDNDGGILADNVSGPSSTMTYSELGTALMWYPAKYAFRAGYVSGLEWDDANIGMYSLAMGFDNSARSPFDFIWGGKTNITALGGLGNNIIAGGLNNTASGTVSAIVGGEGNVASSNSVVSGKNNIAFDYSVVGGGESNTIYYNAPSSVIAGGYQNRLGPLPPGSATDSSRQTISGGAQNTADTSTYSTISGGRQNTIDSLRTASTITGGQLNSISANYATISGGYSNTVSSLSSTVSGGSENTVSGTRWNIVAGGKSNTSSGSDTSAVLGGGNNIASGNYSSVLGGLSNTASGITSLVVGGSGNKNHGDYSIIGGRNMYLSPDSVHAFLWGYSATLISPVINSNDFIIYSGRVGFRDINPAAMLEINLNLLSTDDYLALTSTPAATVGDKFIIKNTGNIGVNRPAPTYPLHFGNGAYVDSSGNFMPSSSREYKENIANLDVNLAFETLSNLSPVRFNYINEKNEEYIGFIAEDVPQLLVNENRQGLAPLDIAAVLTKVIAYQDKILARQKKDSAVLIQEIEKLKLRIKDFKNLD